MMRWMTGIVVLVGASLLSATVAQAQPAVASGATSALNLLWEQVDAQPGDFGLACVPLDDPAATYLYNAYSPFPLASVTKILIFIAYAERLEAGRISLDERVETSRLDLYNLPRTDRGAHDRFMSIYPEGTTSISLWDLAATGMIQYSSNAASDYLLDRLYPTDWDAIYAELGLSETSHPNSLTMIPLLMNNHETGKATLDEVDDLSAEQGERYLDLYIGNGQWRQDEIAYRSQSGRGTGSQFPEWDVQSAILEQQTATGSVADWVKVMEAIYADDLDGPLSYSVKAMTRAALRWHESDFINQYYVEYGSKLGFYSGGTLALVAYGRPIGGSPVISVTFFRNIPRQTYNQMVREDSVGDLAHWLNFNDCAGLGAMIDSMT
ncbi:MAG: serine hydrolase [Anaerolineae bacterium]|nr:serine hydrolase [Anaerolineae bacterium]